MDDAMDYENKKESSKHLTDIEVSNKGVEPHSNKSEDSVSSSASSSPLSSSSTSSEVLSGEDVIEVSQKSQSGEPKSSADKPNCHLLPQNQLIGSTDYDPNRIPSSIFASKPASPLEWSVASNESLFSIPVGNGSFSRDQFFMFYKSGELYKYDEMMNPPVPPSHGAPHPSPVPLPAPPQAPTPPPSPSPSPALPPNLSQLPDTLPTPDESQDTDMKPQKRDSEETKMLEGKSTPNSAETEVTNDNKSPVVSIETDQQLNNSGEKKATASGEARHSSSMSCRSDGSNNSTCSFAFPVLAEHNDQGKYGSNMNVGFHMGRQHSPRPQHRQDQQKSPELGGNRAQSLGQSQDLQPQTPATTPKADGGWFSCFYCCPSLRC